MMSIVVPVAALAPEVPPEPPAPTAPVLAQAVPQEVHRVALVHKCACNIAPKHVQVAVTANVHKIADQRVEGMRRPARIVLLVLGIALPPVLAFVEALAKEAATDIANIPVRILKVD